MSKCKKCKHIQEIMKDEKYKCLTHGLGILTTNLLKLKDKQKLKLIKVELRMK